jgi:hypothetical protein
MLLARFLCPTSLFVKNPGARFCFFSLMIDGSQPSLDFDVLARGTSFAFMKNCGMPFSFADETAQITNLVWKGECPCLLIKPSIFGSATC